MARWAPDARERLEAAAWELFVENGYEATTVAQIAERAGLNRATFFRHFADKREVVLAGENVVGDLFVDAIRAAPPEASPVGCLDAALVAVGSVMTPERRVAADRRIRVVAINADLQERGQLKLARIATSAADALRSRGVDELTARLAAEMGLLAFRVAFERWMRAPGDAQFAPLAAVALADLRRRATELHVAPAAAGSTV